MSLTHAVHLSAFARLRCRTEQSNLTQKGLSCCWILTVESTPRASRCPTGCLYGECTAPEATGVSSVTAMNVFGSASAVAQQLLTNDRSQPSDVGLTVGLRQPDGRKARRPLAKLPTAAAVCSWVQVAAGRPVGIQLRPAEGEDWRHSSVRVAMPRLSPVSAIQTFLDLWQSESARSRQ